MGYFKNNKIEHLSKILNGKTFKIVVILLVLIKIFVLPLTSYPFDFASLVYQPREFFGFDISPLDSWNKGVSLLGILFLQYSLYATILDIINSGENILLLHFLIKLPLALMEILTGVLIYSIVKKFYSNNLVNSDFISNFKAKLALLFWLSLPLSLWVTDVHGQYVGFTVFFIILSLYFLFNNKNLFSIISLTIASTIHYIPLLLLPFYIKYFWVNSRQNPIELIKYAIFFSIIFLISFLPFFLDTQFLIQLIDSLIHHTKPDSPLNVDVIQVPDYSILKFPYYLIFGKILTNVSNPALFDIVNVFTYIGIFLVFLYTFYFLIRNRNSQNYNLNDYLTNIIIVFSIFFIFLSKMQSHYFLFLIPLYIIYYFIHKKNSIILLNTSLISSIVIINELIKNNLGIFFLDIFKWGTINFWININNFYEFIFGFASIILIIINLIIIIRNKSIYENKNLNIISFVIALPFIILITYFALYSYILILQGSNLNDQLASDNLVLKYILKINSVKVDESVQEIPVNNFNFYGEGESNFGWVGKIDYCWFFYSFGKPSSMIAKYSNNDFIEIKVINEGATGELTRDSNNNCVTKIDSSSNYNISVDVKGENIDNGKIIFGIRLLDKNNKLIPNSFYIIGTSNKSNGWTSINGTFRTLENSYYLEEIISYKPLENRTLSIDSKIYIDNIKLKKIQNNIEVNLISDKYQLIKSIFGNNDIQKRFLFYLLVKNNNENISNFIIGNCQPTNKIENKIYFNLSCINNEISDKNIYLTIRNSSSNPVLYGSIDHINNEIVYLPKYKIQILILAILSLLINFVLVFFFLFLFVKSKKYKKEREKRKIILSNLKLSLGIKNDVNE